MFLCVDGCVDHFRDLTSNKLLKNLPGKDKRRPRNGSACTASVQATRSTTSSWATAVSLASTRAKALPTPVFTPTESKSLSSNNKFSGY